MHAFLWNVLMDNKSWESKNVRVRSHLESKSTFASASKSYFNIMSMITSDFYAGGGHIAQSLRLCSVAVTTSIIFEKANAGVNAKCEWTFPRKFLELSTVPSWLRDNHGCYDNCSVKALLLLCSYIGCRTVHRSSKQCFHYYPGRYHSALCFRWWRHVYVS